MSEKSRPQPRRLIKLQEAADRTGLTKVTIRRRIADGSLTGYRMNARVIRVDQAEVDQLFEPMPTAGRGGAA